MIIENQNAVVCKKTFICIFFLLIPISCSDKKIDYIKNIPQINEFEYTIPSDWENVYEDTLDVTLWHPRYRESSAFIARLSNIEEINKNRFLIYDPVQGKVFELDSGGVIIDEILEKGRGPNEVLQPFAIDSYKSGIDTLTYIFDGGNKAIIKLDKFGKELNRRYSETISERIMDAKVEVLNQNSILYPNYMSEKFSLLEFDSTGSVRRGWIQRLVPLGKQPVTYNDVTFAVSEDKKQFVYSYQGLPLIFADIGQKKFVLNLEPMVEISEINTPMDFKEESVGLSVSKLIRAISLSENSILVGYLSDLFVVPFDKEEPIYRYSFIDESGEIVKFHFMEITEHYIFLIDGFRSKMYRLNKNFSPYRRAATELKIESIPQTESTVSTSP